jgi:hypothetical protein
MPVHENPANRHARTTRLSHSRWAISGTHPANRREFGDPFCSVLFCSVLSCSHTGLPHMDSPLFKKTHAEPPHTDGPNLKRFIQVPHSQIHNSIPINSISCIKSSYHAILHKFKRLFDIHNMQFIHQIKKKDYLPQSMHFFVLFVKRPGTRT